MLNIVTYSANSEVKVQKSMHTHQLVSKYSITSNIRIFVSYKAHSFLILYIGLLYPLMDVCNLSAYTRCVCANLRFHADSERLSSDVLLVKDRLCTFLQVFVEVTLLSARAVVIHSKLVWLIVVISPSSGRNLCALFES